MSERVASQASVSTATGTDASVPTTATVLEALSTLDRSAAKSLASRLADIAQAGFPEAALEMSVIRFPSES